MLQEIFCGVLYSVVVYKRMVKTECENSSQCEWSWI